MRLKLAGASNRFQGVAAGERFLERRLTVKFDCDLRGHFVDGFLNFVGSPRACPQLGDIFTRTDQNQTRNAVL